MRTRAEFGEGEVAGVGEFAEAECAVAGVEPQRPLRAVGEGDGLVLEVDALLGSAAAGAAGGLDGGLGGGDPVDGQQAEVSQQLLVVDAAQGGVVDDALGAGGERCEAGEAVHGGGGFAAGGGDPFGVDDDAAGGGRAYGDEHELDAEGCH